MSTCTLATQWSSMQEQPTTGDRQEPLSCLSGGLGLSDAYRLRRAWCPCIRGARVPARFLKLSRTEKLRASPSLSCNVTVFHKFHTCVRDTRDACTLQMPYAGVAPESGDRTDTSKSSCSSCDRRAAGDSPTSMKWCLEDGNLVRLLFCQVYTWVCKTRNSFARLRVFPALGRHPKEAASSHWDGTGRLQSQAVMASQAAPPAVRWFQPTATGHIRSSRYVRAALCPARRGKRWHEHAGFATGRIASGFLTSCQSWHFNLPKRYTRN